MSARRLATCLALLLLAPLPAAEARPSKVGCAGFTDARGDAPAGYDIVSGDVLADRKRVAGLLRVDRVAPGGEMSPLRQDLELSYVSNGARYAFLLRTETTAQGERRVAELTGPYGTVRVPSKDLKITRDSVRWTVPRSLALSPKPKSTICDIGAATYGRPLPFAFDEAGSGSAKLPPPWPVPSEGAVGRISVMVEPA